MSPTPIRVHNLEGSDLKRILHYPIRLATHIKDIVLNHFVVTCYFKLNCGGSFVQLLHSLGNRTTAAGCVWSSMIVIWILRSAGCMKMALSSFDILLYFTFYDRSWAVAALWAKEVNRTGPTAHVSVASTKTGLRWSTPRTLLLRLHNNPTGDKLESEGSVTVNQNELKVLSVWDRGMSLYRYKP